MKRWDCTPCGRRGGYTFAFTNRGPTMNSQMSHSVLPINSAAPLKGIRGVMDSKSTACAKG